MKLALLALLAGSLSAQTSVYCNPALMDCWKAFPDPYGHFEPYRAEGLGPADPVKQPNHWQTAWRISIATLLASTAADAYTSYGKHEANPLLRSGGTFGVRGIALKGVGTAALIGGEALLGKRHRKMSAIANFGMTGLYGGASWHNAQVR
jgi:hypothetical protein